MLGKLEGILLRSAARPTLAETSAILDAYRAVRPDKYAMWVAKEIGPIVDARDDLREIQIDGLDFLVTACEHENMVAVSRAWGAMRSELLRRLREQNMFGRHR